MTFSCLQGNQKRKILVASLRYIEIINFVCFVFAMDTKVLSINLSEVEDLNSHYEAKLFPFLRHPIQFMILKYVHI